MGQDRTFAKNNIRGARATDRGNINYISPIFLRGGGSFGKLRTDARPSATPSPEGRNSNSRGERKKFVRHRRGTTKYNAAAVALCKY